MPAFPVVDTHLHIWDPARLRYPWLSEAPPIAGPHFLDDYLRAITPTEVEQMVFVQCECDHTQFLDEVTWVTEAAQCDPRLTGIVAWAPLEKGAAARPALEQLAQNKLVKGIRRPIQHAANPISFAQHPDFIAGVRLLAEFNFTFDLCIHHPQLAVTIDLVRACPQVNFILDHIGKPGIRDRLLQPWADQILTLAKLPNVWCKISGLITEANPHQWSVNDLRPYFDHVRECFGPDRLVFGGDWPVVLMAGSLNGWIEALDELTQQWSPNEKQRLYRENGRKFYRLAA